MKFQRRLSPRTEVNLVPMIDVVFQLVIFFMVATTLKSGQAIPLVLPGSSSSETVVTTKLMVQINSEDEIYFNDQVFDINGLSAALQNISAKDRELIQNIVVEGDRYVSYELMVKVLDALRNNGFKGISLKTRKAEE
ncbi:MAG: biopolymer transporter ExbD [Spirochaetales bacterium]|nr:biopolymer transporter ExbD [Spirochaetales bacterium]